MRVPTNKTAPAWRLVVAAIVLCFLPTLTRAFSATSEAAATARLILRQALSSPSRKLTYTPELVIPEPSDPTALLLQSTEVIKLSERVRTAAKANAALIGGSLGALTAFCGEQDGARGNFPGPVPAIAQAEALHVEAMADIAKAGACGILLPVFDGNAIATADDIANDDGLKNNFEAALAVGLQPIPEICIGMAEEWGEEEMTRVVDAITEHCDGVEPVAVLITMNDSNDSGDLEEEADAEASASSSDDDDNNDEATIPLPRVSKSLGKRVPILGSVRAVAGGGRMGTVTRALNAAGFNGAILRKECVPGLSTTITDLEAVGGFWSAAIGDLKSVKSKSFGFRANMAGIDESMKLPNEWYKYQKSLMESGALGEIGGDKSAVGLDTEAGDYRGF